MTMANVAYSEFSILGNEAVSAQIEEWERLLKPIELSVYPSEQEKTLRAVFFTDYKAR